MFMPLTAGLRSVSHQCFKIKDITIQGMSRGLAVMGSSKINTDLRKTRAEDGSQIE